MEITKLIAKITYIASWLICVLPNSSTVQGYSYDEPTVSEHVMQILQNDEVVEDDDVCYFPKYEPEKIEDFGIKDHLEHPETYDSGDYGDY